MRRLRAFPILSALALALASVTLFAAASFPTSVKSFTTKIAGDTIQPAHINDLQAEVTAIETSLLNGGYTTAADGVAFPATQVASADANTLDDYEEGSFTPTLVSSGGGTPTYTTQVGRYVKVGSKVTVWGRVTLATKGTLAAGTLTVESLPFTSANVSNVFGGMVVPSFAQLATSVSQLTAFVNVNATTITLRYVPAAGATTVTNLSLSDVNATFDVVFSGTYLAAN